MTTSVDLIQHARLLPPGTVIGGPGIDILGTEVTPKRGASALRVTVALSAAVEFRLAVTPTGSPEYEAKLNGGAALVADALYAFAFPVSGGATYNFRLSATATVRLLIVEEVTGGEL